MSKSIYLMRRYAERKFGSLKLNQTIRTNKLEYNWYDYKVAHLDDLTIILDRS